MSFQLLSLSSLLSLCLTISILTHPSSAAVDSYVYGGCSQQKYAPGTPYATNVNSLLTSLVNSAASATYNNFKISVPGSSQNDVVYGLFQCRGDVSNSDCRECVSHSVSQLGVLCVNTAGGALQLEGCFVKYDKVSFLGVQDKSVVMKKCAPSIGYDSDALTRRDSVLDGLAAGGQYFRVGGSGKLQGVAQCVQDLSVSECQDCLAEAIGRLKSECGPSAWGDMFLGKCYARYSVRGDYSRDDNGFHDHSDDYDNNDDDEPERTLAILIGLIAGVALLIFLLHVIKKSLDKK
ncbi:Cysteine-rich repeat secretory protein like, partial [Actinidia chinensis var. chinensis]